LISIQEMASEFFAGDDACADRETARESACDAGAQAAAHDRPDPGR
jgi:hypothetical protein